MIKNIMLTQDELMTLKRLLGSVLTDEEVIIFGSRVSGSGRNNSDLDLAIKGVSKLDWIILSQLRELFEASDFHFRIDFMDYHRLTASFQKIIEETGVPLDHLSSNQTEI